MLAGIRSAGEPATISAVAAAVTSAPVVGARLLWKHCRQSTGRPCVGLNGTVVSTPHSEHSVRVSVRDRPAAAGPVPVFNPTPERLDLHGLQRFGSFLNCLSKKKSCSPAVKMNSPPQSAQVNSRSRNSIAASPVLRKGRHPRGPDWQHHKGLTFTDEHHSLDLKGARDCDFAEFDSICRSM
jgi:hypothetical protein